MEKLCIIAPEDRDPHTRPEKIGEIDADECHRDGVAPQA